MNRRAIWAIIGLMSVGLIGTAMIQIYWFRSAIQLQESRFDANVFDALTAVRERLAYLENKDDEMLSFMAPSDLRNPAFIRRETRQFLQESDAFRPEGITGFQRIPDTIFQREPSVSLLAVQDPWLRYRRSLEMADSWKVHNRPDLEERIKPADVRTMITQELADRGIDIQFNFGIYANRHKDFIVINDNFVVPAVADTGVSRPPGFSHAYSTLFTSPYQVMLFPSDLRGSPGTLQVHFPNKSTWLWSSFIPTLLGTILFTALILFCFSYTIWVIFRQKKVSEMKTDFINNMTHEFKTPIATISLAADSITSPQVINSKEKIERFSKIIKQENKRMLSQVEKVLQIALIDKKEFKLKVTAVDMHQVIRQAIENANLQVHPRGGRIDHHLEAVTPTVEGDVTHLANVISNLLDNANKYSPLVPEISVHTRNAPGGIEVIVQDRGIGMSGEAKKQIFEKFYRVPTGNLHDVKGFGLGLSYVKVITEAHSGRITVESEPGKGSSFILYLPHHLNKQYAA